MKRYSEESLAAKGLEKSTNAVIGSNDVRAMYYYAIEVKGAPIEKLAEAIKATGNSEYIYKFALNVKGAPIEKLVTALIEQNAYSLVMQLVETVKTFVYEQASVVNSVLPDSRKKDLDAIANAIYSSNNEVIIRMFNEKLEELAQSESSKKQR